MTENIYRPDYSDDTACQILGLEWIYCGVFGVRTEGTFVEIGAHDGKSWSNTYFLATLGWRGIYVEPVEHLWVRCVENHKDHPKVGVIRAMVGKGDTVRLWRNPNTDYLFTGNEKFAVLNQATAIYGEFSTLTLDTILDVNEYPIGFDLLVIDVEGMETDVLEGFNCGMWLPKMVIIETHELNPNAEMAERTEYINQYFHSRGYMKIYTSAINTIFVSCKTLEQCPECGATMVYGCRVCGDL